MKAKHKRLYFVILMMLSFSLGCIILFFNLRDNLVFFYSPTEVLEKKLTIKEKIRLGGMVKPNTLKRTITKNDKDKIELIQFEVSDLNNSIIVTYIGILPDLFKEGQGVVVEGKIASDKTFTASKVLAKHDENYMPPEVKDLLSNSEEKL
mgnify:FL=1|tara:strand:+ start:861 stop:1310 length:450 start_codon:yes stop_codon:yes gene_type:complete